MSAPTKVLLTGASGMVGRNLLSHRLASSYVWLTPASSELNLLDATSVQHYIDEFRPDMVIHAAGKVGGIQANVREPVGFLVENLTMGQNVLIACARAEVPRLINLGSSCMYPKDRRDPLREEDVLSGPLEPTNEGYALAKITIAKLADYISRQHERLDYKTLIPCNLYGPHDKFDPRWSHLIPAVLVKLHQAKVRGDTRVDIWGTGEARREFLYVEDLIDAIYLGIEQFESMPPILNIGLGTDYSINEYYQAAAKIVGYKGTFYHDTTKPTGMQRKLCDIQKATSWGWHPRFDLESGLAATYEHYLASAKELQI